MALGLRFLQRHDFRMRLSRRLGVPLPENFAIGRRDDATDTRIRGCDEHGLSGQGQSLVHVLGVD